MKKHNLMPALPNPTLSSSRSTPSDTLFKRFDATIILHGKSSPAELGFKAAKPLGAVAQRANSAALVAITAPDAPANTIVACKLEADGTTFDIDEQCRKAAALAKQAGARKVAIVIDADSVTDAAAAARAGVYAMTCADFVMPKFGKAVAKKTALKITVYEPRKTPVKQALATARGNCLARWLTALPPNLLDAEGYREIAEKLAKTYGWQYKFTSAAALKRKGAGAFTAVAQGNEHNEAGIVQLRSRAKGAGKRRKNVALVGKGIIFDTGGTNLKPFDGMLNMHIDMGGSAVALGSLLALSEQGVNFDIDVWLAITENRTGPSAYKSQDVVTALNGKTIQTIHTDAEGRMVLADTLTMASREKPDCLLDFATLTGACVSAVTTRYSGVFTNRASLHPLLKRHGVASGERVWPFPIGGEFKTLLSSETADIKQCAPGGGGDHILAATFLNEFVTPSVPWVHMDLSACEHKGGLGAIPTAITGFGVRYTVELLNEHLGEIASAKGRS
ncbi:MAG: leucyl aminopeptidase family protein [Pseudomonadota bacterium]